MDAVEPEVSLRLLHVAVAVPNLDDAAEALSRLGLKVGHREIISEQGVEILSLSGGEVALELLRPLRADSPIGKFLARRGPGLHHIALAVPDLPAALDRMRRNGVQLIDERPRHGGGGRQIAFLHPRSTAGVLVELVQVT